LVSFFIKCPEVSSSITLTFSVNHWRREKSPPQPIEGVRRSPSTNRRGGRTLL